MELPTAFHPATLYKHKTLAVYAFVAMSIFLLAVTGPWFDLSNDSASYSTRLATLISADASAVLATFFCKLVRRRSVDKDWAFVSAFVVYGISFIPCQVLALRLSNAIYFKLVIADDGATLGPGDGLNVLFASVTGFAFGFVSCCARLALQRDPRVLRGDDGVVTSAASRP